MKPKINVTTTNILWAVYIAVLTVLLPHTAWAFRKWEPTEKVSFWLFQSLGIDPSVIISYVAAFAFEASIAILTHKLAKHIEETPKGKKAWYEKILYRYFNPISLGLVIVTAVSALANLAHAVEYGPMDLKIFTDWGIPQEIYSFAFGGILPFVSLIFARVLSNVVDDEESPNPELTQANETIRNLRKELRESESKVKTSEDRARQAEERFNAVGDLVKMLFGEDKRQRILAAHVQWPDLSGTGIAIITGTSGAYVSEVLKENA